MEIKCRCKHTKDCHNYHYKDDGKTKRPCLAWCPCSGFAANNLEYLEQIYNSKFKGLHNGNKNKFT